MTVDVNIYYPSLITMLFLFFFMLADSGMEKSIKHRFYLLIAFAILELFAYVMEVLCANMSTYTVMRTVYSAIGYSVRPALLYLIITVAIRNSKYYRIYTRMLLVLLALNVLLAFSAFWTNIMYSFTDDNEFIRGPLGYFSHVVALFLEGFILIHTLKTYRRKGKFESLLVIAMLSVITLAMFMETGNSGLGVGRSAISTSIVFYYMFFQTQSFVENIKAGEHKRLSLEYENSRDGLTALLNKGYFSKRSAEIMEDEETRSIVCIFLDLDNFKAINDSFGHAYGDEVLKKVGAILKNTFRKEDLISRFGGDEFCILLSNVPVKNVTKQLKTLLGSLRLEFRQGEEAVHISTSIGAIYCDNRARLDYDTLFQEADKALYESKQRGKNQYTFKVVN